MLPGALRPQLARQGLTSGPWASGLKLRALKVWSWGPFEDSGVRAFNLLGLRAFWGFRVEGFYFCKVQD